MRILSFLKRFGGAAASAVKMAARIDDTQIGKAMLGAVPGGQPFVAMLNLAAEMVVKAEDVFAALPESGVHKAALALATADAPGPDGWSKLDTAIADIEGRTGTKLIPGKEALVAEALELEIKVQALLSNAFGVFPDGFNRGVKSDVDRIMAASRPK